MAYGNTFPIGYQSYYPQYQNPYQIPAQMSAPQQQQQNSNLIWVQGEAGAKSYLVAPNNTVQLWDSESQVIYLKSADASGMPSMRILDYTIRSDASQNPVSAVSVNSPIEVSKKDLEALQGQIDDLKSELDSYKKEMASHESSLQSDAGTARRK